MIYNQSQEFEILSALDRWITETEDEEDEEQYYLQEDVL